VEAPVTSSEASSIVTWAALAPVSSRVRSAIRKHRCVEGEVADGDLVLELDGGAQTRRRRIRGAPGRRRRAVPGWGRHARHNRENGRVA
jgi:hypothetical protein